ncbi:LOW QUALITY PROTEIN: hypothetical protein CRUP_025985 [Coryphaenoides rupestris]|nr:LOW QUALITY PROTEIN: hypothetical protein CRUP_025985 [Coryphaenoides rupestris]
MWTDLGSRKSSTVLYPLLRELMFRRFHPAMTPSRLPNTHSTSQGKIKCSSWTQDDILCARSFCCRRFSRYHSCSQYSSRLRLLEPAISRRRELRPPAVRSPVAASCSAGPGRVVVGVEVLLVVLVVAARGGQAALGDDVQAVAGEHLAVRVLVGGAGVDAPTLHLSSTCGALATHSRKVEFPSTPYSTLVSTDPGAGLAIPGAVGVSGQAAGGAVVAVVPAAVHAHLDHAHGEPSGAKFLLTRALRLSCFSLCARSFCCRRFSRYHSCSQYSSRLRLLEPAISRRRELRPPAVRSPVAASCSAGPGRVVVGVEVLLVVLVVAARGGQAALGDDVQAVAGEHLAVRVLVGGAGVDAPTLHLSSTCGALATHSRKVEFPSTPYSTLVSTDPGAGLAIPGAVGVSGQAAGGAVVAVVPAAVHAHLDHAHSAAVRFPFHWKQRQHRSAARGAPCRIGDWALGHTKNHRSHCSFQ